MSKSTRKPYVKDKGYSTSEYWQVVRHNWKQHLHSNYMDEDLIFRSPKSLVNDYDYCDWRFYISKDMDWMDWRKYCRK